ncbi:Gfo/Idh/MocA family oxidoreductase [Skeletonema marinoi]|uniref:Gfo/Idh/MocA family oxidoreductase n=1 Tax=Skeletonema marinoi TaxID=267567 RepID=A0AAD9DE59_9STRA|nr:Gfo/Idh/MocA family oxidoreductase [Skeletonema marinoi]|mmetsp:Transcript_25589/g.51293  ORF Transcript_25589/g.51293 Transcript_25589/m.51293 type:complete len:362 (+) Transcript_25589:141-1226(+)
MSERTVEEEYFVSWGIVGCGAVCEVKSGPAFYNCVGSKLEAVMSRDFSKAQDFALRHSVDKAYTSVSDLVNDASVDAVYVATPPGGDRVRIASLVATAKKPCYMEKPLGRDGKEAKEISDAFEKANVPLYVAYYRRCMPKFVMAKKALDEKKIGNITGVTVTLHQSRHRQNKTHWRYNKEVSGGGLFMDIGCHMLDLVEFMIGPILNPIGRAYKTVDDQSVEDNVRGCWEHICPFNGSRLGGSCVFNFSSGGEMRDEIEITGTDGRMLISCFDTKPAELRIGADEIIKLEEEHPSTVQQPMIQLVTQELFTRKECNVNMQPSDLDPNIYLCSGESAVRTSVVVDQLLGREKWSDDYIIMQS